tara:strand:+ start:118 stop:465 length:348 start_codon:yes stop_codon:yes gene_type:complete
MRTLNDYFLTVKLTNVSTSSSAYVVAPDNGKIIKISSVLGGVITGGNAAITCEINGAAVTGAGLTITHSGSAAGDVDTSFPTAANNVLEGDVIELITNGGSTNTHSLEFTIVIRR